MSHTQTGGQTSTHTLPSLADLQAPDETAFKADAFLQLVNRPCPADWIKPLKGVSVKNSHGQYVPWMYLPIDKVKFLLTRLFGAFYKIEVLRESVMFNSVAVTVRLHYCIPQTSTWLFQDGTGGVAVQTDKGEAAANLGAIKADGVKKAFPAAMSFAVSNAAANIGKVFGGDLNKDDALEFNGAYSSQPVEPQFVQPVEPQFIQPAQPVQPQQPAAPYAVAPPAPVYPMQPAPALSNAYPQQFQL